MFDGTGAGGSRVRQHCGYAGGRGRALDEDGSDLLLGGNVHDAPVHVTRDTEEQPVNRLVVQQLAQGHRGGQGIIHGQHGQECFVLPH